MSLRMGLSPPSFTGPNLEAGEAGRHRTDGPDPLAQKPPQLRFGMALAGSWRNIFWARRDRETRAFLSENARTRHRLGGEALTRNLTSY